MTNPHDWIAKAECLPGCASRRCMECGRPSNAYVHLNFNLAHHHEFTTALCDCGRVQAMEQLAAHYCARCDALAREIRGLHTTSDLAGKMASIRAYVAPLLPYAAELIAELETPAATLHSQFTAERERAEHAEMALRTEAATLEDCARLLLECRNWIAVVRGYKDWNALNGAGPDIHIEQAHEIAALSRQWREDNEAFVRAINRRVKVENKLLLAKQGLTDEECVALALELGTPEEAR